MVANFHYFDGEQVPDPEAYLHRSKCRIRLRIEIKRGIRFRISTKVMRIRNTFEQFNVFRHLLSFTLHTHLLAPVAVYLVVLCIL